MSDFDYGILVGLLAAFFFWADAHPDGLSHLGTVWCKAVDRLPGRLLQLCGHFLGLLLMLAAAGLTLVAMVAVCYVGVWPLLKFLDWIHH